MNDLSTRFWVGVDVSKEKFDAAVCYEAMAHGDHRLLEVRAFPHDARGTAAFLRWVLSQEGVCAGFCAESTGVYSLRLAVQLRESKARREGMPDLSIVNPLQVKGTARALGVRDKSDVIDARVIAVHGAQRRPRPRPQREDYYIHLRSLFRLRESYLAERIAAQCRLETAVDRECRRLVGGDIQHFKRQVAAVEKLIAKHVRAHASLERDAKLLTSVPGVGRVVAVMMLAEFGDLRGWSRREVVAFAGVYPREHSSGRSVRGRPCLAKGGGGVIRKTLYMPAIRLLRNDVVYNRGVQRMLSEEKRAPMCCVGAAMRKLLLVMRAVVVSGQPFDPAKAA